MPAKSTFSANWALLSRLPAVNPADGFAPGRFAPCRLGGADYNHDRKSCWWAGQVVESPSGFPAGSKKLIGCEGNLVQAKKFGGCSSVGLERQPVTLEAAGSSPVTLVASKVR
jgi:hypothetical protein